MATVYRAEGAHPVPRGDRRRPHPAGDGAPFRKLDALLAERPLRSWARYRWGDLLLSIHWLYDRTGEPWLLDLAARVADQGFDWRAHFKHFPYWDKVHRIERDQSTHGVNVAMGLKAHGDLVAAVGRPGRPRRAAPDARPARPLPRAGDRHVLLRRAPGGPESVAGQRAVRRRRGDVFAGDAARALRASLPWPTASNGWPSTRCPPP